MSLLAELISLFLLLAFIVFVKNAIATSSNHYLYVAFGAIGIVIHETGHLVAAVLLRHKIVEFQPFKPNQIDNSLGYVTHSYKPSLLSPIANSIIGLAPLLSGIAAFVFITNLMRPDVLQYLLEENLLSRDLSNVIANVHNLYQIIFTSSHSAYLTLLWLFLSYSVLVHCVPSKADFSQSFVGLMMLFVGVGFLSGIFPNILLRLEGLFVPINYVFTLTALALIFIITIIKSLVFIRDLFFRFFKKIKKYLL